MNNFKPGHAGLLLAVLLILGCGGKTPSPGSVPDNPATFVGSARCQSCHEAEYANWLGSHHQLAMQDATNDTVLGDFDGATFDYYGTTTRFFTRDGGFYVTTADASGQDQEFRIAYVFGVEPLQQYLVEFPGGRLQSLAFSWDSRSAADGGQRWFHIYEGQYIAPDDSLHWTGMQQNWNYMCAECHSTNVIMGYDADADAFDTTYSEISVGCEACHGPGSKHIDLAESGAEAGDYGLAVNLDDQGGAAWVMEPTTARGLRSLPCASRHHRAGV